MSKTVEESCENLVVESTNESTIFPSDSQIEVNQDVSGVEPKTDVASNASTQLSNHKRRRMKDDSQEGCTTTTPNKRSRREKPKEVIMHNTLMNLNQYSALYPLYPNYTFLLYKIYRDLVLQNNLNKIRGCEGNTINHDMYYFVGDIVPSAKQMQQSDSNSGKVDQKTDQPKENDEVDHVTVEEASDLSIVNEVANSIIKAADGVKLGKRYVLPWDYNKDLDLLW
jgi:hypothetical protein